jgi:hypothetical protein
MSLSLLLSVFLSDSLCFSVPFSLNYF